MRLLRLLVKKWNALHTRYSLEMFSYRAWVVLVSATLSWRALFALNPLEARDREVSGLTSENSPLSRRTASLLILSSASLA